MRKLVFVFLGLMGLMACNPKEKAEEKTQETSAQEYSLVGKKALLVYPDFKAEVSYITDSTLHWKTTTTNGEVAEGNENIFAKKLNDYQFFLNWVEEDGTSISQIVDLKDKKVFVFSTFADENSPRGKRNSADIEGTFEFIEEK